MSTPEPLDEFPAAPAETRGGDRLADITTVNSGVMPTQRLRICDSEDDEYGEEEE